MSAGKKTTRESYCLLPLSTPNTPISVTPLKSGGSVTTTPRDLFIRHRSDFRATAQAFECSVWVLTASSRAWRNKEQSRHCYLLDSGYTLDPKEVFQMPSAHRAEYHSSTKSVPRGTGGPNNLDHTQVGSKHCSKWSNTGRRCVSFAHQTTEHWFLGCIPQKSLPVGTCSD